MAPKAGLRRSIGASNRTTGSRRSTHVDPKGLPLKLGGGATLAHYQRGEFIYRQGEPADAVFYVYDGKLKISVHSPAGKEALLTILGPGEFCGEACLTGLTLRIASAAALTDCAVMRITVPAMRRALRSDPKFSECVMAYLLNRGLRIHQALADQLLNSTEKRLARTLLRLVSFGDGGNEPVVKGISHEMLAGMVGATRARVTHFMSKFRDLGLIDYDRNCLRIHNSLTQFAFHDL